MLKLRYYQQQAIDNFFDFVSNPENHGKHPLIVLPTAAGKSLVQAYIVRKMLAYDNTRILLITHQSELIKQNYTELVDNFNHEMFLDIGIYSAGLKCRDTQNRILFAGIQSVHKKSWELGWFDLVLVDEAHLVNSSNQGMYRKFFNELEKINPKIVIGGLTATHYRMKSGLLTEGKEALFDAVCHETSIKELIEPNDYRNKDKTQYLCKLISKSGVNRVDLTGVHVRAGEYVQKEMEHAFTIDGLVRKSVNEIIEYTKDRKKVLIFTSGIKHCTEVFEYLNSLNKTCAMVHSKQDSSINEENIEKFKKGEIKYFINVDVLTTGFNEKAIDCIAILRSTKSAGLFVQICGRGLRLHPDKNDCLILDFGKNLERFGPIDKIEIKKTESGKRPTGSPVKECPKCHSMVHLSTMICPDCDYEFPQKPKHEEQASNNDIISEWKKPETVKVLNVVYSKHEKIGKTPSMKVSYYYNMYQSYDEWQCLDHEGYAKRKSEQWIKERIENDKYELIKNVDTAIKYSYLFKNPEKIIVDLNGKFPKIIGYIFPENEEKNDRQDKENELDLIDEQLGRLIF